MNELQKKRVENAINTVLKLAKTVIIEGKGTDSARRALGDALWLLYQYVMG